MKTISLPALAQRARSHSPEHGLVRAVGLHRRRLVFEVRRRQRSSCRMRWVLIDERLIQRRSYAQREVSRSGRTASASASTFRARWPSRWAALSTHATLPGIVRARAAPRGYRPATRAVGVRKKAPRVAGEPDGLADHLRNRPALAVQVSLDLQLVGNVDGQVCNCSSVLPELRASAGFDDHPR